MNLLAIIIVLLLLIVIIIAVIYTNKCSSTIIESYIKKNTHDEYLVDLSTTFITKLLDDSTPANQLYIKKNIYQKPNKDEEINVTWEFNELSKKVLDEVPKTLYGWYHESTSSNGKSCINAIDAFDQIKIKTHYLGSKKDFSLQRELVLSSIELGKTTFTIDCPFFTVPYGCASEYGGKSDDLRTLRGTIKGGGIYTIPTLSQYSLNEHVHEIRKASNKSNPFFLFQFYVTIDNDINISIIERSKELGVSIIVLTIDTGTNNHGGIPLMELQADLTYSRTFCSHLFNDPVFNIKCYNKHNCVGTTDIDVLQYVSNHVMIPVEELINSFNSVVSLDYAKSILSFGNMNVENNDNVKSIRHISSLCHMNQSISTYSKRNINKGVPLVVKGCLTPEDALLIQEAGADGVYVSNHGGRFTFNAPATLDVVTEIRTVVKKVNNDFGVWLDGGVRHGAHILMAYAKGAEFVGVGRPIIYSGVLYGEAGVSSITKKMIFELNAQAISSGLNHLNDYSILKSIL